MVRDKARAAELARRHSAPAYYDNIEDLLADPEVDAVYISTPVDTHRDLTLKAARAGKHVLCEKPMALNAEQCHEMIEACKAAGVKLGIGFMRRFHPCHRKIKELIGDDALGRLVLGRVQTHSWYPPKDGAWRQVKARGGGGPLMDIGSHCIDLLRFFMGEVMAVAALCDNIVHGYEVEDIATVLLRFENGAHGVVDCSFVTANRQNLVEVYGTEGTLIAQRSAGGFTDPKLHLIKGREMSEVPFDDGDQYALQFEAFARAVLLDEEPPVTGMDGLINIEVIQAAYRSSIEGRRIEL